MKRNPDGTVERYKARLVAKGYHQVHGLDYIDSFSPVAKMVTVRLIIALSSAKGWPMHQVDINNAFLHDFLDGEVYMHPPEGYTKLPQAKFVTSRGAFMGLNRLPDSGM